MLKKKKVCKKTTKRGKWAMEYNVKVAVTPVKRKKKGTFAKIVRGNPYDHSEYSRESEKNYGGKTCNWCGQKKKTLYKYNEGRGLFCSKGCYRDYNGLPSKYRC